MCYYQTKDKNNYSISHNSSILISSYFFSNRLDGPFNKLCQKLLVELSSEKDSNRIVSYVRTPKPAVGTAVRTWSTTWMVLCCIIIHWK